jgi:cardiolipin synthase
MVTRASNIIGSSFTRTTRNTTPTGSNRPPSISAAENLGWVANGATSSAIPNSARAEVLGALRSDSAITRLSDAALAAASGEQKVEMLKTLLSFSNGTAEKAMGWAFGGGGNTLLGLRTPSTGAKQDAILRILRSSSQTPGKLDFLVSRVGYGNLLTGVTGKNDADLRLLAGVASTVTPGDWKGFDQYVDEMTGTHVAGRNKAEFLLDGAKFLERFYPDIDNEKESINITVFQLQPDEVGNTIADKLIARAKAGVKCRVLLDEYGSTYDDKPAAEAMWKRMRDGGVEVLVNPKPLTKEHLDHRKIFVFGGKVGYTGGMNLGHHYQGVWHDQQTRFEGQAVKELQKAFISRWKAEGGEIPEGEDKLLKDLPEVEGGSLVRVLPHEGNAVDRNIKFTYLRAINTAEHRVRVANPYFSDPDVVNALCNAAQRGVAVEVLLPRGNDQKPLKLAAESYFPQMLKAGVKVYEYHDGEDPGRMAHMKVCVFDNRVLLGSSNLDARSLEFNDECNVLIDDKKIADQVSAEEFDVDIQAAKSTPVTEAKQTWTQWFANKISWGL